MTLNEYKPAFFTLAPARNPIGEVRWWRYLKAGAYVNPFHDLLYALSRNPASTEITEMVGHRQLTFGTSSLTFIHSPGQVSTYPYVSLGRLKCDYTCFYDPRNPMVGGSFFLRVFFVRQDEEVTIDLATHQRQCKQLFKELYRSRVNFQEYYMGSRSFLLDTEIPYKKVQKLKAEYGIDW